MPQKSNTHPGEEPAAGEERASQVSSRQNDEPRPGTERYRDEQRQNHGPVAAGQKDWKKMDERGDRRFGVTRADDSDPELIGRAHGPQDLEGNSDDDESPTAADDELDDAEGNSEIESGGQRAGMSRGEKPHKAKRRGKPGHGESH